MQKEPIKYKIICTTPTDYELNLEIPAKDRLLLRIFSKSKRLLSIKGINVKDNKPEAINEFPIIPSYYKILKTILKRQIKEISKDFAKDGIELLNFEVIKARFKRNPNTKDWIVYITVSGVYADKR